MIIKIKRLNKKLILPKQSYKGDAGVDLYSSVEYFLDPGMRKAIPTGIAISIPDGYAGFIQPRSGLAMKHGISVVNTPGLIDSKYRGELKVILINTDKKVPFHINVGDRIAQLVIQKVEDINFVEVNDLEKTERGESGFGSTD